MICVPQVMIRFGKILICLVLQRAAIRYDLRERALHKHAINGAAGLLFWDGLFDLIKTGGYGRVSRSAEKISEIILRID